MAVSKEIPQINSGAEDSSNIVTESSPSPEKVKLVLKKDVAVPGPASVGKDEATRILNERHGWHVFDGSSSGFKRKGTSHEKGYIKRARKEHRKFDYEQGLSFESLTESSEHKIHQTRLSGIILAEKKDKRERQIEEAERKNRWHRQVDKPLEEIPLQIPAISILLWARKEVRVQRAFNQKMEAYEDQQRRLASGEVIPEEELIKVKPTLESVEEDMENRQKKDVLDWEAGHRDYIREGEDPFSRTLKRKGKDIPVYDYWIDTSDLTPEQVADRIEKILLSDGAARPLSFAELDAIGRESKDRPRPGKKLGLKGDIFDSTRLGGGKVNELEENGHDKTKEIVVASAEHQGEPMSRRRFKSGETHHPNPLHPSNMDNEIVA